MPINATVTAKVGPNIQATAVPLVGMAKMTVNPDRRSLQFFSGDDANAPEKEFDLNGVTTFTVTISGGTYTVVVS